MLIDLLRGTGRDMLIGTIPDDGSDPHGKGPLAPLPPPMLPGADAHACACHPR